MIKNLLVVGGLLLGAVLPVQAQSCASVTFAPPPLVLKLGQALRWPSVFTFTPSEGCTLAGRVSGSTNLQLPRTAIDFPYSCVGAGTNRIDCQGTGTDAATLDADLAGVKVGAATLTVTVNGVAQTYTIQVIPANQVFLPLVQK